MYAYAITETHNEKLDKYLFIVDSEKNAINSYTVIVKITSSKIYATCSCNGFAIKGHCKHINLVLKKIKEYRSLTPLKSKRNISTFVDSKT
ncbi:hypothetical protein DFR86_01525 [Acidianus sulfidivorans JP7]|uniref:SWIM-type domain-containing protein n=1 Tax=Acidianus sulfidivorans JP7 TaxID=619593 RepID=A0A2U9IK57_9CREN|nr:hypothetical protein [Acidianus sulfidivorans]AWR96356.1 hypothetical protein DFR86_01525 [Acidianus sulfidivorans JP7]